MCNKVVKNGDGMFPKNMSVSHPKVTGALQNPKWHHCMLPQCITSCECCFLPVLLSAMKLSYPVFKLFFYSETGCSFARHFAIFSRNVGILIGSLLRATCELKFLLAASCNWFSAKTPW